MTHAQVRRSKRAAPIRMTGMDDPRADPPEAERLIEGFTPEQLRNLYRSILLPRMIEEKMLLLLRQGRLAKWFSGIGQEAIATGVVTALEPRDFVLPMHRNLGVFTGRDVDLRLATGVIRGTARGIDAGGALLVDTAAGRRRFVSGEVSVRIAS